MAFNRIIQRSGYRNYFAVLIIQGAIDHYCLENCSGAKYKIFTSYHSIECYTIQKMKPIAWVSTASSSRHFDHSYVYNNSLKLKYFAVENPPLMIL